MSYLILLLLVFYQIQKKKRKKIDLPVSLPFSTGTVKLTCIKANGVRAADMNGLSDPYVNVGLLKSNGDFSSLMKSRVHKKTLNPVWNEVLAFELTEKNLPQTIGIAVQVWDKDFASDDFLGQIEYLWANENTIFKGVEETVTLKEIEGSNAVGVTGTVTLKLQFQKK